MNFLVSWMSLAGISQSSIGSFGTFLIFFDADSSADDALDLAGLDNVVVGDEDSEREGFDGLVVETVEQLYNSSTRHSL